MQDARKPSPMRHPLLPTRPVTRPLAVILLAGLLAVTGCATRPPADDPEAIAEFRENNDPAEPFNRRMYGVHDAIDRNVLRPVAVGYRQVVPGPVRLGVRNVLGNLRSPVILLNDMLQGNPQRAGDTLGRFVVNSTVGLGGIFDVAGNQLGVRGHTEDFGQTLATWGVGEGPYVFVPVLGPSNPRDLAGFGVDIATNPFTWLGQGPAVDALSYSRAGATVVDTREDLIEVLDDVNRSSLDPYATLRSGYRQRRNAEIGNGNDRSAPAAAGGTGFGSGTGLGTTPAAPR